VPSIEDGFVMAWAWAVLSQLEVEIPVRLGWSNNPDEEDSMRMKRRCFGTDQKPPVLKMYLVGKVPVLLLSHDCHWRYTTDP
jgi:hypothetical protein